MKLVLMALVLIMSVGVDAKVDKDKLLLTQNIVEDLVKSSKLDKLRVTLGKRVVIENAVVTTHTEEVVDGEIVDKTNTAITKIIIGKRVKGLITKYVPSESYYSTPELYVSFDSDCFDEKCSYKFTWDSEYQGFYLYEFPETVDATDAHSGYKKSNGWHVSLRFSLKEYNKTIKNTIKPDGH